MVSSDIKNYIQKQRSFSVSDDVIKNNLKSVGWILEDISNAFLEVDKENKISEINDVSDIQKNVPTNQNSSYTKDPYREPVGSGSPEAKSFISPKDTNLEKVEIKREWSSPNKINTDTSSDRQGQKFTPKYQAVTMDDSDNVRNNIPELKKVESKYVGSSFVPNKTLETSANINNINQAPFDIPNTLNAFKVMPKDISNISNGNLSKEDFDKLRQVPHTENRGGGFFRWFLFIVVFLFFLIGSIVFAEISGYIDLPIKIPILESLKKDKEIDTNKQDIFVPIINTEDNSESDLSSKNIDQNLIQDQNLGDVIESEPTVNDQVIGNTEENKSNPKIKQDININDSLDENQTQQLQ